VANTVWVLDLDCHDHLAKYRNVDSAPDPSALLERSTIRRNHEPHTHAAGVTSSELLTHRTYLAKDLMSGPKHLWSGDWRQESADAAKTHTNRPPAVQAPAEQPPPVETPPRRPISRGLRRGVPIALTAIVLVGAAVWGLTALLGSGSHKSPTFANAPTTPSVATPASIQDRPVYWLGMQIETVAPGAAVVDTVRQGSPGELAGLSPGDLILAVNGRSIHGAGDIVAAIQGLKSGDQVLIQVSHGSALFTAQATLAAPPSDHP
jgi:hypothetical protein